MVADDDDDAMVVDFDELLGREQFTDELYDIMPDASVAPHARPSTYLECDLLQASERKLHSSAVEDLVGSVAGYVLAETGIDMTDESKGRVISSESSSFTTPIRLRLYSDSRLEVEQLNAMSGFEVSIMDMKGTDSICDPHMVFHCTAKPIQQERNSPLNPRSAPAMISATQRMCAGRVLFCFTPKMIKQPLKAILQNCVLYMRAHLLVMGNPTGILLPDIEFDERSSPREPYILLKCATGRFVKGVSMGVLYTCYAFSVCACNAFYLFN